MGRDSTLKFCIKVLKECMAVLQTILCFMDRAAFHIRFFIVAFLYEPICKPKKRWADSDSPLNQLALSTYSSYSYDKMPLGTLFHNAFSNLFGIFGFFSKYLQIGAQDDEIRRTLHAYPVYSQKIYNWMSRFLFTLEQLELDWETLLSPVTASGLNRNPSITRWPFMHCIGVIRQLKFRKQSDDRHSA